LAWWRPARRDVASVELRHMEKSERVSGQDRLPLKSQPCGDLATAETYAVTAATPTKNKPKQSE